MDGPKITYVVNARADEANRALADVEQRGQKAGDNTAASFKRAGAAVESSVRESTRSVDRMLNSIEQKSKFIGKTQLEADIARAKALQASFMGSDPAKYDKATAALQRFEAQQRRVNEEAAKAQFDKGLAAAQAASQRAATAANQFQRALLNVSTAHKSEQAAIEGKIRSLEREAALKGKTGAARVAAQAQQFSLDNPNLSADQSRRAAAAFEEMGKASETAVAPVGLLQGGLAKLAGSFAIAEIAVEAGKKLLAWVKEATVGATLYAARTQQLKFAQDAVAVSSNISAAALENQVQKIQALNITQQDARLGLSRLVASNMDYTKAAQLARIAQNLGRIANITTAESFERLVHGAVTAQPELLRALGLNVSFEQAYARMASQLGKTAADLSENEKRQAALNAVLEAGARYNGVYEASSKTAAGQILSMNTYLANAKQVLGEQFLPLLTPLIAKTVEWAKALPGVIQKGRELLDTVLAPLSIAAQEQKTISVVFVASAKTAQGSDLNIWELWDAMRGAAARAGASALRGAAIPTSELDAGAKSQAQALNQRFSGEIAGAARFNEGQNQLGQVAAQQYIASKENTLFSVQQRLAALNAQRESLWKSIDQAAKEGKSASDVVAKNKLDLEANFQQMTKLEAQQKALQKAEALPEQRRELEITAAKDASVAWGKAWGVIVGGQESAYEKAAARLQQLREEHKLTDAIAKNIMRQADAESFIARLELARKQRGDAVEKMTSQADAFMKSQDELTAAQGRYRDESTAIWEKAGQERVAIEEATLSRSRDAELRKLDMVRGYSVAEKVAVEQQKLAIEQEYLNKSQALQRDKLDREISDLQRKAFGGAADDVDLAVRFQAIDQYKKERLNAIEAQGTSDMSKVRDDAAIKQVQIISDAWQRQYDSLKRGFEGLFDSALTGGKNFFDSLRRIALGAFLTPVKELSLIHI